MFLLFGGVNAVILSAKAEEVCKVTDPTDTPLNVRETPNGKIINQLKNGKEVYILEIAHDNKGISWAKISGYHNGKYRVWGWVFREFISCYNR
ncbi:SH3 domain-containing protein [Okeanomitos corallinicola TIOX110]|uniref:SH3 domain-containing protein n=1 Tax=Okeanomitos corallinicola TIOX110 TaxID=3133117 RepID=A0ABZ2UQI3_9CYAN